MIKFCVKLSKTGKETHDMIKEAYGDADMGRSGVFEWHKLFREGRERVEDDDCSGRLLTSKTNENVSRVKNLLNRDHRMSIRTIADDLSIPQTQVFEMVKEKLAMRKVCVKFVPRVLSKEKKANQKAICQDLLHHVNEETDFLDNVVTGDEMWVFEYNPESKRQSTERHTPASPRPKKARMSKSKQKSMFICFFDRHGVIHKEFVPPGQPINAVFYMEVLTRLRKCIACVRTAIVNNCWLHHDNPLSHTVFRIVEYLAQHKVATLPQPPLQPRLGPARLFSIPENKIDAQGEASRIGRGALRGCDEGAKQHSSPGIPGGIRKLENSLAAVCRCGRVLL
uniref:Mos1 transposase HTH domain-containing protein n=1 Tax=Cairina moschata TaxID=8855 RepID=A0A8C3BF43_CAIMO